MIGYAIVELTPLIVPNGTDISNGLSCKDYEDAAGLVIASPATLDGGTTYYVESGDDRDNALSLQNWGRIEEGDPVSDLITPAAGKRRAYFSLPMFPAIRVKTSAAVGADRTFRIFKAVPV